MSTIVRTMDNLGLSLPMKYWVFLIIAFAALYIIGLDQGQTLSLISGKAAYQINFLHELFHDVRHAAGFVCH